MSNYDHGATLERAAKTYLQDNGYRLVVKSGGSKGKVDLVAMKRGETLLVQCKTDGYLSPLERTELWHLADELGHVALVCGWVKNGAKARHVGFTRLLTGGVTREPWSPDWAVQLQGGPS